jgi:hypothetical protein
LLERPAGRRLSNHILSAKKPPCDRRLGCFDRPSASTISNRSSITKNSAKSTTESALTASATTGAFAARLRDLRRLSAGVMGGQSFYQSDANEHPFDAFAMCNGFKKM